MCKVVLNYYLAMDFEIWVDADSVPTNLRQIILRAAGRLDLACHFVADRELADVKRFAADDTFARRQKAREEGEADQERLRAIRSRVRMVVVPSGANSADDHVVENAKQGDLCITHDIPLASRLLDKGCTVIDDRGHEFTEDEIRVKLSERLVNQELRSWGVYAEQQSRMGSSNQKSFSDMLDRALTRLAKKAKEGN